MHLTLNEALRQIANDSGLDAAELIRYAAEDNIGGRDTGDFPGMSTFAAEGQILYALIRAMKPSQVVEIGVDSGGTTTHILTALEMNGKGKLYSVDIKPADKLAGNLPDHLRHCGRWTLMADVDAVDAGYPDDIDFVWEDGSHTYDFTKPMLERIKSWNVPVLSHDAFMPENQGFYVDKAFKEVFPDGGRVITVGSIAGLAYNFT